MVDMEGDKENNNTTIKTTQERKMHLRNMLDRIETIGESEETGLQAVHDVNSILTELCLLEHGCPANERIEHPDETLLDAMVINSASQLVLKCVEAVDLSTNTYDSNDFSTKLLDHLKDEDSEKFSNEDILKLLDVADSIIKDVPVFSPLYGTYDVTKMPEPVQPKVKTKRLPQEKAIRKELIRVENKDKEEQGIDDTVNFLLSVLNEEYERNGGNPIGYYKYVINTDDFGQTVQNIFYTSFLVRDGKAKLNVDQEGNPTLEPIKRKDLKRYLSDKGKSTQIITSISMENWQLFKTKGYLQCNQFNQPSTSKNG